MCKKTHKRLLGFDYYTFNKGEWYELITRDFYDSDTLGYYTVKHPEYLNQGFIVSKLFLQTRFFTPAEWREIQIDSILND